MTVVDVGANKGQMALIFAALVGPFGTVVAIEPAPGPFASLQRNVRLNNLQAASFRFSDDLPMRMTINILPPLI
jgi:FkbM family methyltransferase